MRKENGMQPAISEELLQRIGRDRSLDEHPKAIPVEDRRRELAAEHARAVRDNPPERYVKALESWGFKWVRRSPGWRHARTGSTMPPEEAVQIGADLLRQEGWEPGEVREMWVQKDLRMAFAPEDLGTMFPGQDGPYDLWHWISHRVAQRIGVPKCNECGKVLGPPETCGACGMEMRSGNCPKCSFIAISRK